MKEGSKDILKENEWKNGRKGSPHFSLSNYDFNREKFQKNSNNDQKNTVR